MHAHRHEGESFMSLLPGPSRVVIRASVAAALVVLGASCKSDGGGGGGGAVSALAKPDPSVLSKPAPDSFKVAVETSKGNFTILAHRDWSPRGVDRFYHLVQLGYFDDTRFFRVLQGFMAQFGLNGDPRVNAGWEPLAIQDDSVTHSNKRGTVTFAKMDSPNTRSTQLFINYADNSNLDAMGFSPIGEVVDGMAVVDSLYSGYGEGAPQGAGPDQGRIATEGNAYLTQNFPKLDFIRKARIVP
jgi:peptidyl-prolyl cis-trans isomerase A (cyclophilin A)